MMEETISLLKDEIDPAKIIGKACDQCRKRKIRCEALGNSCKQCIRANVRCIFTLSKPKKGPRRPPGYKHVAKLEGRLEKMEAMLEGRSWARPEETSIGEEVWPEVGDLLERDSRRPSSLPVWTYPATSPIFNQKGIKKLPTKDEARILIQETLSSINSAFPIFDAPVFQETFESHYDSIHLDDPGWRASLNVVFAFAYRFRAMKSADSESGEDHAWGYLQNALSLVSQLAMLSSDLMAVQALLGMTIMLQGTPASSLCSHLISTAVRLAQSMKLHRRDQVPGLTIAEVEQRKRVFWLLYIYDKDISLRTTNPPSQDDDDMDVELPTETIDLHPQYLNDVNFYNYHIGLAIIQGQIYRRLISAKARKASESERILAAKELCAMLDGWKNSIAIAFSNDNGNISHKPPIFFTSLHTVILKFGLFHAVNAIYQSVSTDSRSSNIYEMYLIEARESMQLLPLLPQGNYACIWLLLDFIIVASTIIFSHVVSNSIPTLADESLKLVEPVFALLEALKLAGRRDDLLKMEDSLVSLKKEVEILREDPSMNDDQIGFAQERPLNRKGISGKEIRTKEDFIRRIEQLSAAQCSQFNK